MLSTTLSWHPQWSTSSSNERVCWAEATEHVNENPSADLQDHIFAWVMKTDWWALEDKSPNASYYPVNFFQNMRGKKSLIEG